MLSGAIARLGRPSSQRRLRTALLGLLLLWAAAVTARAVWLLVPAAPVSAMPAGRLLNPMTQSSPETRRDPVDVEQLLGRNLFGAAADAGEAVLEPAPDTASKQTEGIEEGARETRLDLALRGVAAAREEGGGFALIENRGSQQIYAVGDALPGQGRVTLAKVLRDRVVLNNNGTFELLVLYDEDSGPAGLAMAERDTAAPDAGPVTPGSPERRTLDRTSDVEVTRLAGSFRERLYENPQSLAEVVRVAPVREDGELRGYRITPGTAREDFNRLGFRAGDLVTAVNGVSLDDPSNTLQLYQMMRTAGSATVDIERDGQPLSIAVNLE